MGRYIGVSPSGVMAATCRHGIPIIMVCLKKGERYVYPEMLLMEICKRYPGRPINLSYDINCSFEKYWKKHHPEDTRIAAWAIPIFHAYGHNLACQLKYLPRRIEGFGMTDGEAVERMWAQLRGLVTIVRESRYCVYIDVITLQVSYITTDFLWGLADLYNNRLKRMNETLMSAEKEVRDLLLCQPDIHDKYKVLLNRHKTISQENPFVGTEPVKNAIMSLYTAVQTIWTTRHLLESSSGIY